MKTLYLHILHISHHLCKIHVFLHIFFEHFHDFKTHTYVQIKIKFSKIAFLSKYCKFDIWSYFQFSFSKLRYMNFVFFLNLIIFFLIFEFDYIVFFFYKKEVLFRYFVIRHSKFEFIEYRDMKHEVYIILNIVDYR